MKSQEEFDFEQRLADGRKQVLDMVLSRAVSSREEGGAAPPVLRKENKGPVRDLSLLSGPVKRSSLWRRTRKLARELHGYLV